MLTFAASQPRGGVFWCAFKTRTLVVHGCRAWQSRHPCFQASAAAELEHPRSYLVTIVTRLSIDLLRPARRRREEYVGVWLPEPVPTRETLADDLLANAESASFAFLLLLERLSPLQRAVLVLHDVFDYSHGEVAVAIGRTVPASRQILRRARLQLGDARRPPIPPTVEIRDRIEHFFAERSDPYRFRLRRW